MMTFDAAAREFEVVESEIQALYQSRISVSIALEGERSQSCEAFVCGGKSGSDLWVAAVVYLTLTRRTLVYRYDGKIGKEKEAFDGALQEACEHLIPLGFELDAVNLKYSQAMRQVVLKGIRGLKLTDAKGAARKSPALSEQRKGGAKDVAEKDVPPAKPVVVPAAKEPEPLETVPVQPAAAAYGEIEFTQEEISPVTAVIAPVPPAVVATAAPAAVNQEEIARLRARLQAVEQEKRAAEVAAAAVDLGEVATLRAQLQAVELGKTAAEAEAAVEKKKYQAEVVTLLKVQKEKETAEVAIRELKKQHVADLAALRKKLESKEDLLAEAQSRQEEIESRSQQENKKETALQGEIAGLKAELKALRDETQKAMRQVSVAEAATKEARAETDKIQKERDALAKAAEKERGEARKAREQQSKELAQAEAEQLKLVAELQQAVLAAKEEAATERVTSADRLATLHGDKERAERESARLQGELQAELVHAQNDVTQLNEALVSLQEESGRIIAEQEEKRRALAVRLQATEAEVDRLMQSMVDTEATMAARSHAQESAMAERVAVLKGVVEQLWPVDGVAGMAALDQTELARIAAAPLKLAGGTIAITSPAAAGFAASIERPAKVAIPLPKIPIVPPFPDEIEEPVAAAPVERVVADEIEPAEELEVAGRTEAETAATARFFDNDFMAGVDRENAAEATDDKENIAISFDDEDWGDLDLSEGSSDGEPVMFHHDPNRATWSVELKNLKELHTSVNVQQIAPPGGGPGTFQAFVCLVEADNGPDECCVVLEHTDGSRKKLVYVPDVKDVPPAQLVKNGLFFVESIGFMLLAVDLRKDSAKRTTALNKCRSFVRG